MKITVTLTDGTKHSARPSYPDSPDVWFRTADDRCPACKTEGIVGVHGVRSVASHDEINGDAETQCCKTIIGRIRVQLSTIFGLEEDERVCAGPWKVY